MSNHEESGTNEPTESVDAAFAEMADRESSESQTSHRAPGISSWGWFGVGILAAVVFVIVSQLVVTKYRIPLPPEYATSQAGDDNESSPEMGKLEAANKQANHARLLFALSASFALIFGITGGVIHGRIIHGILGGCIGGAIAFLVGMFGAPLIMDLSNKATADLENADMISIGMHITHWALVGLPAVVAISIAALSPVSGAKSLGAIVLAAALAGVIYVIGIALLDPTLRAVLPGPPEGNAKYLWCCLAPILSGLFLSRSRL